ncbi:sulfur carrier protein ThiS [Nocardioides sp. LHD-245]|uniref:sulfur carrier protein ThiS n=1 Tax=Nocardioides sp. LHD-245 TaxID=3051387 RepID=UPI0027E106E0|nr:sulfur carrier protein ThiS [Nocardioides sp. LHD-245]
MTITCNGEPVAVAAATVADLLERRLGDPRPAGVAVAVNEEVVPRGDWPVRRLAEGDVVEVVTAVQGG